VTRARTATEEQSLVEGRLERLLSATDPDGDRETFMGAQFDLGLAWVQFPEGRGGLGVAPRLQTLVDDRLDGVTPHRPRSWDILGHGMGAPMLIAHGDEPQLDRWLRPMFVGVEVWCQMFSEPGSGSDVAGVSSRAEQDGDEWIVNGQKVWTTLAHVAQWGMLLLRTDPSLPKHKGMSYFVVDMHAPGVEVRPLRQITGEAEFNEVYFTDVLIPNANLIGNRGDGWRVGLTTLMNERVAIGSQRQARNEGPIGDLITEWQEHGGNAEQRDRVTRLWAEAEVARLTNLRAGENRDAGTPGPEGSTAKLVYSELNKRIYEMATELMGPLGMLYDSYAFSQPRPGDAESSDVRRRFLRSRANSIEGGTSEIMKNILGERVLGLPGEPRTDSALPWSEVPRG
jgi:alkylation response protein AidB-like acyl-CoA dehydrogenase